ncbi:heme ABC transporter ATP-binding protein [Corynebacterium sp.]|uniref:heme ABC transporter ATP-binding protein n=1 Tax=Corynebacterium sp. TaxID=1720 RepID=UPI002649DC2C|nr:heme ABC transporter ATP-binding protein [Corynebacterium sp.]MDN5719983.1 heme ABC transporter ATP-binding protein [Corynebacterium sp.]
MSGEVLLSAQDVVVSLGGRDATEILHGVDLEVHAGEVLGLIGPNGAGKSTLLGVLSGDTTPVSGEVLLAGRPYADYRGREAARVRSVMLQDSRVSFAHLVRDVVEMGRSAWSGAAEPAEKTALVDACLQEVGMFGMQDRDVTTLSGGERARVAFARVMAQQARCMMLDEPTAAMDIGHQERTMRSVRRVAAEGAAAGDPGGVGVIVVLHDLNLAARYCDRLALLSDGRVDAVGAPGEVCTSERLSRVYDWPVSVDRAGAELWIRPTVPTFG